MKYDSDKEIRSIIYKLNLKNVNDDDLCDSIDHGELVASIAARMASKLNLSEEETDLLVHSAIVHDVGKLKLSENIYGRKKSMHIEEVRHMRMHAKLGAEMLKECGYERRLIDIVYHHHECYDGSGYPDNLRGEDISPGARILRVCDAFAALVSDRPYRKAFDKETAIGMMIEDNKDFDVKLFLTFMNMVNEPEFDEIMELAEEYNGKHGY